MPIFLFFFPLFFLFFFSLLSIQSGLSILVPAGMVALQDCKSTGTMGYTRSSSLAFGAKGFYQKGFLSA
jgi:hypothetical protein